MGVIGGNGLTMGLIDLDSSVTILIYYTDVWSPLTSRIYEKLLTGSELCWGNLAAQKFELQTLVAPRGKKYLFLGSEYFARGV